MTTTADLVKDTSTTAGAANITVAGTPPTGYRAFTTLPGAAVGIKFGYKIANRAAPAEVEVGIGTVVALNPFEFSRAPAGGAALLVFSAGTKDVEQVVTAAEVNDFGKVSEGVSVGALPAAGSVTDPDILCVSQNGADYKITFAALMTAIAARIGTTPDTTKPILSSPTGTQTGTTTASGTVSTDEANGTLYCLTNTAATSTDDAIKAGASQAITAAGVKNFAITGLTANTTYYNHYLHRDNAGNDSIAAHSAAFTTAATAAVPSTMAAPVITKGDGQISIAWVAPAANGSAIIDATFTASTGQTATGTSSPTIMAVPNGTAVTVTGKARNGVGPAANASPPSNSVTPAAVASAPVYELRTVSANGYPNSGKWFDFENTNYSEGVGNPYYYVQPGHGYSCEVWVRTAAGVPAQEVKAAWSKSATVAPIAYSDTTYNGQAMGSPTSTIQYGTRGANWQNPGDNYYGMYAFNPYIVALQANRTANEKWYLWILTSDGFAAPVDDGTGVPLFVTVI